MRKLRLKVLRAILSLLLACLASMPAIAQEGDDQAVEEGQAGARVLGHIEFPTSTESSEAQQAFIQGMLLLHLFEYPYARDEFLKAQQIDPGFTMAYWGEAMTSSTTRSGTGRTLLPVVLRLKSSALRPSSASPAQPWPGSRVSSQPLSYCTVQEPRPSGTWLT